LALLVPLSGGRGSIKKAKAKAEAKAKAKRFRELYTVIHCQNMLVPEPVEGHKNSLLTPRSFIELVQ